MDTDIWSKSLKLCTAVTHTFGKGVTWGWGRGRGVGGKRGFDSICNGSFLLPRLLAEFELFKCLT